MINVSETALRQATMEYLQGPPPGEVTGQWIDRLIFQIDDTNPPLAAHLRHLLDLVTQRHGVDIPLDVVMITVWTIFRAEVLTRPGSLANGPYDG